MSELFSKADAIEAIEKERKYLSDRGQVGAEHILVHHALNVLKDLPTIDLNYGDSLLWAYAYDKGKRDAEKGESRE